ncbi:MAG: protein-L-isoaspartate(D-aspartate) O-methyltransferase [Candidatus Aminicenantia bacterium]
MEEEKFTELREKMVTEQIEVRGVKDKLVLNAMRKVPRHLFIPEEYREYSYEDEPLPIKEGQTISQPYIVAYMTEALRLRGEEKVLEIGTGSGYQTAILSEIVREVYTIEIISSLSHRAQEILGKLGYRNIYFKIGDGTFGWKEHSPYQAILVTAAPSKVPKSLKEQIEDEGRIIIPVGSFFQELVLVTRKKNKFKKEKLIPVRFVPLISTH